MSNVNAGKAVRIEADEVRLTVVETCKSQKYIKNQQLARIYKRNCCHRPARKNVWGQTRRHNHSGNKHSTKNKTSSDVLHPKGLESQCTT
jgi:hypothetical protein